MLKIKYVSYSKILNKSFENEKIVKCISDFNLYVISLNLNVKILSVENFK